jgi:hypothetical protein|tara:strand:- start:38 stop:187 length:150 start_codon:yes stop_codon:yes gene_type:complete
MAAGVAAGAVCFLPARVGVSAQVAKGRWITELVYDKGLGMKRAIERFVP